MPFDEVRRLQPALPASYRPFKSQRSNLTRRSALAPTFRAAIISAYVVGSLLLGIACWPEHAADADALLARAAQRRGVTVPSVRAVILTYGKASRQHSQRIAEAFPAPQVDLYGSTEAGYLFVGEAFQDNLQAIDANAFIELVPWRADLPDVAQIYVTTREREAMPVEDPNRNGN